MARVSQRDRLLQYLSDNGSITAYEAVKELGILQLASRICELEDLGFCFKREWVAAKSRYGDRIRFVRYSLDG